VFQPDALPAIRLGVGLAAVLLYCSAVFYINGHKRGSLAFQVLAVSLALWGALMAVGQLRNPWVEAFGSASRLFGPAPQMLLGIAMVMVLFEMERNAVQESTLALSTLGVDPRQLFSAGDLVPSMQSALDRLTRALPMRRAAICIADRWRGLLPSVQHGFSPEFLEALEKTGAGEYISDLAYRQGGLLTINNAAEMTEPLPVGSRGAFAEFKRVLAEVEIRNLTVVSLQTRENNFGVILFPHAERKAFGSSGPHLMVGLALQLGLTLENYLVMHDAHRRTKEYALLTQIGQAISSRLNQDEVLRTIHVELGRIFDTSNFYIAFQEGDEIRFELEVVENRVLPKRRRKLENAFTEYVIRTGQPLLIRSDLEKTRARLGVAYVPEHPAKCMCAVPVFLENKPAGLMAAMSLESENVFEQRDLDVLLTAAGQVSVAVENARLYEEARRQQRWLRASGEVTSRLLSGSAPDESLMLITELARELSGADLVVLALPDEDRRVLVIEYATGMGADGAIGVVLPMDRSLSGMVMATGEPVSVADFGNDERTARAAREALNLGAAVVVPLGAPGNVRGVLTAGREPGRQALPPAAAEMVATFAAQAAVAVELAEHRRESERLSVFEDRDRIARDLHDLVIQRLYATGMSLEGAMPLIARPELATRVRTAVDAMDETIKDIRATIFALQARTTDKPPGTRARILAVADEMAGPLGFAPSLRLSGPLDDVITGELAEHVLTALREVLSNAARHAEASRVDVTIAAGGADGTQRGVVLRVSDDGIGIGDSARRSGLRNLLDRARQFNGTMRVGPLARGGTELVWRVPLPGPRSAGHAEQPAATQSPIPSQP